MSKIYQTGNTIKLQATFYGFDGYKVVPDIVHFKVYDNNYTVIENISIDKDTNSSEVGVYFYFYESVVEGDFYYEWYGEVEGMKCLQRGKMKFVFA